MAELTPFSTPLPEPNPPPEAISADQLADAIPVLLPAEEVLDVLPADDLADDSSEFDLYYDVPKPPSNLYFWAILIVGGFLYVAMIFVGGEAQRFALAGLESLPFLGLTLLAFAGESHRDMRLLTLLYWLFLVGATAALVLFLTFGAVVDPTTLLSTDATPIIDRPRFAPGGSVQFALTILGTFAAISLGALGFVPWPRRALARRLPFDSDSFVHAVALATILALTAILLVPLATVGEPPLLAMIRNFQDYPDRSAFEQMADPSTLRDSIYMTVWLVPVGIMAVGYPLHRTLREALTRVGLVLPSVGQVVFALTATIVLVVAMTLFDIAASWLWDRMAWPKTDTKQFEEMMRFAISPLGAVVIGVTAGLGEELFARGVLQPRLGILLSNLLFTALHALQYSWDGLLSVFVIGLILGVIRKQTNTSTSAIVHGTYDYVLIMMAYHEIDPMQWLRG